MPATSRPIHSWPQTLKHRATGPHRRPINGTYEAPALAAAQAGYIEQQAPEEQQQQLAATETPAAAAPAAEPARVQCLAGGPYLCFGASVTKADGTVVEAREGKPLALCACGRSGNRPLCDGSHSKAAADAPAASADEPPPAA